MGYFRPKLLTLPGLGQGGCWRPMIHLVQIATPNPRPEKISIDLCPATHYRVKIPSVVTSYRPPPLLLTVVPNYLCQLKHPFQRSQTWNTALGVEFSVQGACSLLPVHAIGHSRRWGTYSGPRRTPCNKRRRSRRGAQWIKELSEGVMEAPSRARDPLTGLAVAAIESAHKFGSIGPEWVLFLAVSFGFVPEVGEEFCHPRGPAGACRRGRGKLRRLTCNRRFASSAKSPRRLVA